MRSPNCELDNDDVFRDVEAKELTVDIRKCTCEGGNRVTNGLPAKLRAGRNVQHVSFLREHGDKLLGVHSLPFSSDVEFSDDFFIAKHLESFLQFTVCSVLRR